MNVNSMLSSADFAPYPAPVATFAATLPPTGGLPIFPVGQVPGERAGTVGNETWNGAYGGSFYDVTVPEIYPRLVSNASTAVLISPGGAYKWLTWELEGESAAAWLNQLNISAYILKYRVPARPWLPFGGAPLMDIQRAIGLIRSQQPAMRVGVLGFSAGSHLSAHVSNDYLRRTYPKVDAADELSCKPDFAMLRKFEGLYLSSAPVRSSPLSYMGAVPTTDHSLLTSR